MSVVNKETAMEERFTYTVVPRKPIRNLIKGKVIIRSENLLLSKDEVLMCLKHGAVYRKFYLDTNKERVTPSNLDRLHRNIHLTQAQYESLMKKETNVEEHDNVESETQVLDEVDEISVVETVECEPEKKAEEEQLPTESETSDVVDVVPEEYEKETSYPAKNKKSGKKNSSKKNTTVDTDTIDDTTTPSEE